jgi:hypothetical protein
LNKNVTLDGTLSFAGGTVDVDGIFSQSATGTLTMSQGGLKVNGDFFTLASGSYNLTGGAVTLDGNGVLAPENSGVFWNVDVNAGLRAVSDNLTVKKTLLVSGGSFYMNGNVILKMNANKSSISADSVISLDDVNVNPLVLGAPYYYVNIRSGGDLRATRVKFDYVKQSGIVFDSGSEIGGNSSGGGSTGSKFFRYVTIDNISATGIGIDFSALDGTDETANRFPDLLREVRFDGNASATNVKAGVAAAPLIAFHLDTGNFGTVDSTGEANDDDTNARIRWNTDSNFVSLKSLSALGLSGGLGVELLWSTTVEVDNLGFHVYRSNVPQGPYERITESLIRGQGTSLEGASYRYVDKMPGFESGKLYYYKLEDVEGTGKRTFHGPVCVDFDRDGLPGNWERLQGLDDGFFGDALEDADGDGLTNLQEYARGFDPHLEDTDGDGILDSEEGVGEWEVPDYGLESFSGFQVIGEDAYGGTYAIEPGRLTAQRVRRSHVGLKSKDAVGRFYRRYRARDLYHLEFSRLKDQYSFFKGEAKLPVQRVLLKVPRGKKISIETLEEAWGPSVYLRGKVEPVPMYEDRPSQEWRRRKEGRKRRELGAYEQEVLRRGYGGRKRLWASLFGGGSYREEFLESSRVEEEVQEEEASYFEEEEAQIDGSRLVEIYAMDKSYYRGHGKGRVLYEVGKPQRFGDVDVVVLQVNLVDYDPLTGELSSLERLRFRVDYVFDEEQEEEGRGVTFWRSYYEDLNLRKPEYLEYEQAVELSYKKPSYSDDGDLNDGTLLKVTWSDLESSGFDIQAAQSDPGGIRVFQGLAELSLGEVSDGFLCFSDRGFYETLFNDRVVLYVVYDPVKRGLRWSSASREEGFDRELLEFRQRVRYEKQNALDHIMYCPDSFFHFSGNIYKTGSRTYGFNLPGLSSRGEVFFNVRVYAEYNEDPQMDQGLHYTLNGAESPYASAEWGGQSYHVESYVGEVSEFLRGSNTLKLQGYLPSGVSRAKARTDYFEVDYPREMEAYGDRLLIESPISEGVSRIEVTGFTQTSDLRVLDVSDASEVREIEPERVGDFDVIFNYRHREVVDSVVYENIYRQDTDFGPGDPNGRGNKGFEDVFETGSPLLEEGLPSSEVSGFWSQRYELQGLGVHGGLRHKGTRLLLIRESLAALPESSVLREKTSIRGRWTALDHAVVVDESLKAEALRYVEHLRSYFGQEVELVTYQDLCKEYTGGHYMTGAISLYFQERGRTAPSPKPRWATIIGSGNLNTKGLWGYPSELPLIPAVYVRGGKKCAGSDWPYAQVSRGDLYPDGSIGRIDCGTEEELSAIIDKIIAYDQSFESLDPKVLFVADIDPKYDDEWFERELEDVKAYFPARWWQKDLYYRELGSSVGTGMVDSLNQDGISLLLYNGHGSFQVYGATTFFNVDSLSGLNSGHQLPLVIEANCLSSDAFHVAFRSLGTSWLQKENAGAIAVIGQTNTSEVNSKAAVFKTTVDYLVSRGVKQFGLALRRAKIAALLDDPKDSRRSISSYILLGPPCSSLK